MREREEEGVFIDNNWDSSGRLRMEFYFVVILLLSGPF